MRPLTAGAWSVRLVVLLGLAIVAGAVGMVLGAEAVSPARLFAGDAEARFIVTRLRLPRVLTALFVGAPLFVLLLVTGSGSGKEAA